MAKPFSIQSPEEIAKEYAGNKQKIAQAMQMGIVDATAGVLAGMFIDRMRAAQMQEMAPQTTVAQQVMGGAPNPPVPPKSPTGGLGALPEAAPPMALEPSMMQPPMEAPAQPMGEAPMGMAAGGIAALPVPDDMFDEPTNGGYDDGYAGGGLVAFGDGGEVPGFSNGGSSTDWMRSRVTSPYGVKRSTGTHQGLDFGVGDKTPIGAPAPGKVVTASRDDINGNFVILEHPDGTRSSYSHLSSINVKPGQTVGPTDIIGLSGNTGRVRGKNGGYHLHFGARDAQGNRIDPAQFFKSLAPQTASGKWEQKVPERNENTATGRLASLEDVVGMVDRRFAKTEEEKATDEALRARAKEMGSDEYYEKQRKDSMWETLAEIGFNMASTKSPSLLQAIGEAASAALPGAKADKKERKQLKDRALNLMMELGAKDRKEAMDKFRVAADVWQTGLSQEQFEEKMALSREELKLGRDKLNAEIEAAKNKGVDVDTAVFQMFMSGDPAMKAAAQEYLGARYPRSVTGGMTPEDIRRMQEGRGGGGGFAEGQTAQDTTGKTIVFRGGQWVYP